jgi:hypothetical protein
MKKSFVVPPFRDNFRSHVGVLFKIISLCSAYISYNFSYLRIYYLYILRTLSRKSKNKKFPEPPNNENEDEDVKAERLKVKELMSCQCCEEVI